MSELKATPGPYRLNQLENGHYTINAPDHSLIAQMGRNRLPEGNNAHLLAASWDLYHALEALADPTYTESISVMVDRAKVALAKARGEQ